MAQPSDLGYADHGKRMIEILPGILGMAVKMIGALIMLLIIEPKFLYVLIPGGAALIVLTYAFRRVLKRLHKAIQRMTAVCVFAGKA